MRLYIIIGIGLLALLASFGIYYKITANRIESLVTENTTLTIANNSNELRIQSLENDYSEIQRINTELNSQFIAITQQARLLERRLGEHDIGYLAHSRPGLVENIITNASNEALRCFDIMSGSPLTQEERNAPNATSFNSECPWLFRP